MIRMKIKLSLLSLLISFPILSQKGELFTRKELHLWAVGESGIVTYYGSLNKRIIPFSSNNTPSFLLGLNSQYKAFNLNTHYSLINYGQNINSYISSDNFKANGRMIGLSFAYSINYLKKINFQIGPGFDFMSYRLSKDIVDSKGKGYNYWSDGTIRDLPENYENIFKAKRIFRDYTYETQDGSYSAFLINLSAGISMSLAKNLKTNLRSTVYLPLKREIDNIPAGNAQSFLLFNRVGLSYYFAKTPKPPENPLYSNVDFKTMETSDLDADGVLDFKDECPETPKGNKVDKKGCLIDSDDDGIPDIRDKEMHSKKGFTIDQDGVGHEPIKMDKTEIQTETPNENE